MFRGMHGFVYAQVAAASDGKLGKHAAIRFCERGDDRYDRLDGPFHFACCLR
jgi:hypothetical protein